LQELLFRSHHRLSSTILPTTTRASTLPLEYPANIRSASALGDPLQLTFSENLSDMPSVTKIKVAPVVTETTDSRGAENLDPTIPLLRRRVSFFLSSPPASVISIPLTFPMPDQVIVPSMLL